MDTKSHRIEIYETPDGNLPFILWLEAMRDVVARARIQTRLNRVCLGSFGDTKAVGGGVYEFRIDVGPGYRIYFSRVGRRVLLLLCGGDKSTQSRDITRAKAYWKDYQERNP